MTNTNSPTYAQVTEIMRAAFEERGAPQWRAYLDDLRSTLKEDAGNEDCIAGSLFSEFWLAVARGDHGSAAAIGYVDSAWLQDARHPSDTASLDTAKTLANTIIDGWEHIKRESEYIDSGECIELLTDLAKGAKVFLAAVES